MSQPSVKRLRAALDENDTAELVNISEFYVRNWNIFQHTYQFLSIRDIARLCSITKKFRNRCQQDIMLQNYLKRERFKNLAKKVYKVHWGQNALRTRNEYILVPDYGVVMGDLCLKDQYGHQICVRGMGYGMRFDMYSLLVDYLPEYGPSAMNLETVNYNVLKDTALYLRAQPPSANTKSVDLSNNVERAAVEYELIRKGGNGNERNQLEFAEECMAFTLNLVLYLYDTGFTVYDAKLIMRNLNSCITCWEPAKLKCEVTGQLYCSKECSVM